MGIIALAFAFIGLFLLPFIFGLLNIIRSFFYKPYMKIIILIFVINGFFLGWIGGMPVIEPYFTIVNLLLLYFLFYYLLLEYVDLLSNLFIDLMFYIKWC